MKQRYMFFLEYAEYIMRNARLDDSQAGIKIAGGNVNNLRYAYQFSLVAQSCPTLCNPVNRSTPYNTMLMAESEEKLKSFLMKVK